jgi:molybdate/tungstate transport system permease protein
MKKIIYALVIIASIALFLFIFIPLFKMIISANPKLISDALADKEIMASIFLSFKCAFFATIIALIAGIPLAFYLSRYDFPLKALVEAVLDIPVMIPHTAVGIALLTVFGTRFFLGKLFNSIGVDFVGTEFGIIIGMMYVSLSYLINHAKAGFQNVDPKLEKAARTLGASSLKTFFQISLPLAKNDILSGAIMMWARGLSEFGAVVILAYHPMTAPVLILERFQSYGLNYSKPIAVLLILICIVIFTLLRWINSKKKY